ncbi:Uncharacterized protein BM_BM427 [Brugia malayi]|uniref:Bm427 n=1 Tax=Brugia malayi TaxID=6279 RepID=A0A0J9XSJ8_BRUMA|nr:Uncharacterized protein BM_BM427 [Brugia malayi]CDP94987.1 Bm427 [Brugia malayi]VIO87104.1 Uncharacterized protein BM_BM427 [Brugia malayi]
MKLPKWTHVFWGASFWCYPLYVLVNLHRVEVVKYDIYGNLIQDTAVAEYWWRYPARKKDRQ